MKRFQKLIADAKAGRAPWEPFPEDRIAAVSRAFTATDVADIFGALDQLAQEKSETPDWDGDTCDDIARAQDFFARLLAAVPAPLRADVDTGLAGARRETREWVTVMRKAGGRR